MLKKRNPTIQYAHFKEPQGKRACSIHLAVNLARKKEFVQFALLLVILNVILITMFKKELRNSTALVDLQ